MTCRHCLKQLVGELYEDQGSGEPICRDCAEAQGQKVRPETRWARFARQQEERDSSNQGFFR